MRKQQKLLTWRGTLVSYLRVKLRLASAIPCFEQYCKKFDFSCPANYPFFSSNILNNNNA